VPHAPVLVQLGAGHAGHVGALVESLVLLVGHLDGPAGQRAERRDLLLLHPLRREHGGHLGTGLPGRVRARQEASLHQKLPEALKHPVPVLSAELELLIRQDGDHVVDDYFVPVLGGDCVRHRLLDRYWHLARTLRTRTTRWYRLYA